MVASIANTSSYGHEDSPITPFALSWPRASGILAHITVLPGRYGIGDLGPVAYSFVDFLSEADQYLWQILPLNPTSNAYGHSPYSGVSAAAGNPLLITLEPLLIQGLLYASDVGKLTSLPADRVDFKRLVPLKQLILQIAFKRFKQGGAPEWQERFRAFKRTEASWLNDYALFAALRDFFGIPWTEWEPAYRDRYPDAMRAAREKLTDLVEYHAFTQFLFFEQWRALRAYALQRNIRIIGDVPFFVALDSADVWAHRELFKLSPSGRPVVVAGVPPDDFSAVAQLWGNPLYDWEAMAAQDYRWWIERLNHQLRLVDILRIDHFRGFESAWEVPADAPSAAYGQWVKGPGAELFHVLEAALARPAPVIAENLGTITEEVEALLAVLGYPGIKVLQFGLSGKPTHPHLPHNYRDMNCVVYTGTHDLDTTRGWFASIPASQQDFVHRYLGTDSHDIFWGCIRLALSSVTHIAIIPLQDILDLGSDARMNTPGTIAGNWEWRLTTDQVQRLTARRLSEMTHLYGRADHGEEMAGTTGI